MDGVMSGAAHRDFQPIVRAVSCRKAPWAGEVGNCSPIAAGAGVATRPTHVTAHSAKCTGLRQPGNVGRVYSLYSQQIVPALGLPKHNHTGSKACSAFCVVRCLCYRFARTHTSHFWSDPLAIGTRLLFYVTGFTHSFCIFQISCLCLLLSLTLLDRVSDASFREQ